MPRSVETNKKQRDEIDREYEPSVNPAGIYSGASRRVFFSDGEYAPVKNKPPMPPRRTPPPNEE